MAQVRRTPVHQKLSAQIADEIQTFDCNRSRRDVVDYAGSGDEGSLAQLGRAILGFAAGGVKGASAQA
jgi:hypothetical protein